MHSATFRIHYATVRDIYEFNTGMAVARTYWKCRECKQRGQEFDNLEQLLAPRAQISEIEDGIAARHGAVSYPVDRDGLKRD